LRFARTLLALGENERADQALEAASRALEASPTGTTPHHMPHHMIGEWWVLKARASLLRRDIPGAADALQRAREVSEALARTDARAARSLQALVQEVRAEVAVATADRDAARTNFRQARDAFRDLGAHTDALRCLVSLGEVELACRDLRRAADTFRAASRLAGAAGLYREELAAEVGLGEAELALGELDEGTQRLRQAFRRAGADDEDGALEARTALGMARAMAARRLWADVSRYAERARTATRSRAIAARAFEVEADAWLGQDQARKAHRALEQALVEAHAAADGILAEALEARLRTRPATAPVSVINAAAHQGVSA
jgi:tetratricopeptide (TPR) repeat protein